MIKRIISSPKDLSQCLIDRTMILGNKTNAGINEETEFVEIKNTVDFA